MDNNVQKNERINWYEFFPIFAPALTKSPNSQNQDPN